jgi:hypothetical protein
MHTTRTHANLTPRLGGVSINNKIIAMGRTEPRLSVSDVIEIYSIK